MISFSSFARFVLVLVSLTTTITFVHGDNLVNGIEIIDLTPQELHDGILDGQFDVVGDVRTRGEWCAGHIPGATHTWAPALLNKLRGCETCSIALYCASGRRAGTAIRVLAMNGFKGKLYNGLGVGDWTSAGYKLTTDPSSVVPSCSTTMNHNNPVAVRGSVQQQQCGASAKAVVAAAAKPVTTQRVSSCSATIKVNGQTITSSSNNPGSAPSTSTSTVTTPAAPNNSKPSTSTTNNNPVVETTYKKDGTVITIRVGGGGGR